MSGLILLAALITVISAIPVALQLRRAHPPALFVLFFTEMWERFSYYGMRALLIFYLTQHFLLPDAEAAAQYAAYTGLAYLLPLLGGVVADRYLGMTKAVRFGAILLVAGHSLMAFEGEATREYLIVGEQRHAITRDAERDRPATIDIAGVPHHLRFERSGELRVEATTGRPALPPRLAPGEYRIERADHDVRALATFYLALSLIALGVGYLKSNISSLVGQLYESNDPRREPGFTLYYYGINLGAFWAAVICGWLGQSVGWWAGFGAAGLGMAAGFVVFSAGRRLLAGRGEPPDAAALRRRLIGPLSVEHAIYGGSIVALVLIWLAIQHNRVVGAALVLASATVIGHVLLHAHRHCTRAEQRSLWSALALVGAAIAFFVAFQQAGTSKNLFAARNVQLSAIEHDVELNLPGGMQLRLGPESPSSADVYWIDSSITASQTQSFNSGFVVMLAPLFAALWSWLGRRRLDPGPVIKFGLALVCVGLSFLSIVWSRDLADAAWRLPLYVLVFSYLLHTLGELLISPVGLSQISRLSPARLVATMMAVWFLASATGQYVAGYIAGLASTRTVGGQAVDPAASLDAYLRLFATLGASVAALGVLYLAIAWLLRRRAQRPPSDGPSDSNARRGTSDADRQTFGSDRIAPSHR